MLMRKAKRKANLELAQQQIKEAIESILRDSKRVAVRGGFKTYADALAECFHGLLAAVDLVENVGLNSAKQCAYSISAIVDAANSAAAICTNKAIQDEIVVRTRDISIETANLLGYATTAAHDNVANQKMHESIASIKEQVRQMLELLAAAGALQQELDDAKQYIERALEAPATSSPKFGQQPNVEACVDTLNDRAKVLSTTIKNIANNACVTPERVGEYSKEAAELMCELLDATNIIAIESGVDMNDPAYIAGASNISEHKKQQIESLLAAAKGFAAATTNMIDLLKQIPNQEDDENLQFRLSMATRSADNALNAFMNASTSVDYSSSNNGRQSTNSGGGGYGSSSSHSGGNNHSLSYSAGSTSNLDPEKELLAALNSIEQSVQRFTLAPGQMTPIQPGKAGRGQNVGGGRGTVMPTAPQDGQASAGIVKASKKMCEATQALMQSAAAAQKHIKQHEGSAYRQDPNWTGGVVSAAKNVAETVAQLVDVSCDPNATPEDVVAAVRCVNGATAQLVAFTRIKGDPNSPEQQNLEAASRAIARAANNLVEVAKRQKQIATDSKIDDELANIKNVPRTRQIKLEFEAQAKIAKLEVDLDEARQYLFKLRRAVYGNSPDSGFGNPAPRGASIHRGSAAPRGGAAVSRGGVRPSVGSPSPNSPSKLPSPSGVAPPPPSRERGNTTGALPKPSLVPNRGGAGGPPRGVPAPRGSGLQRGVPTR